MLQLPTEIPLPCVHTSESNKNPKPTLSAFCESDGLSPLQYTLHRPPAPRTGLCLRVGTSRLAGQGRLGRLWGVSHDLVCIFAVWDIPVRSVEVEGQTTGGGLGGGVGYRSRYLSTSCHLVQHAKVH